MILLVLLTQAAPGRVSHCDLNLINGLGSQEFQCMQDVYHEFEICLELRISPCLALVTKITFNFTKKDASIITGDD